MHTFCICFKVLDVQLTNKWSNQTNENKKKDKNGNFVSNLISLLTRQTRTNHDATIKKGSRNSLKNNGEVASLHNGQLLFCALCETTKKFISTEVMCEKFYSIRTLES